MKTKDKVTSMPLDRSAMNAIRRGMRKVRDLERQRGREAKSFEREAYEWSSLGF